MKKLAIVTIGAAAALAAPTAAMAQTGTIPLEAQVSNVSTIEAEGALAFGDLAPGATHAIDHNDADAGYVHFTTNGTYSVTLIMPTVLTNAEADDDLPVSFTCGTSNTTTAGSATEFTCADGTSGVALGRLADVVVWLGGEVEVPVTALAGSYEGTVTVTMTVP